MVFVNRALYALLSFRNIDLNMPILHGPQALAAGIRATLLLSSCHLFSAPNGRSFANMPAPCIKPKTQKASDS